MSCFPSERSELAALEKEIIGIAESTIEAQDEYGGNPTLSGGMCGLSLFLFYAGRYFRSERYIGHAILLFERCLYYKGLMTEYSPTLYGGSVGVYWLFQHFVGMGLVDGNEELFCAFDISLETQIEECTKTRNYDLLYGLLGIGVYCLERSKAGKTNRVNNVLLALYASSERIGDRLLWYDRSDGVLRNGTVDLGFAHGLASILMFCAKAYHYNSQLCREMIYGIYHAYIAVGIRENKTDSFPYFIRDGQEHGFPGRLGWCYGDLTIAYAILAAGRPAGDAAMIQDGESLLLRALSRRYEKDYTGVEDNGLCHGCAGIIKVAGMATYLSNDVRIHDAVRVWTEVYWKVKKQTGNKAYSEHGTTGEMIYRMEHGFLQGTAGIGLSLLSLLVDSRDDWSNLILL